MTAFKVLTFFSGRGDFDLTNLNDIKQNRKFSLDKREVHAHLNNNNNLICINVPQGMP